MKHSDDIYRLYIREWVAVHTLSNIAKDGKPLFDLAMAWIAENLRGRVREEDINVEMFTNQCSNFWCHIQVFKDNLKGEYKTRSAAELIASINEYDEYTIVVRNSPADHEIRNYGVTKL